MKMPVGSTSLKLKNAKENYRDVVAHYAKLFRFLA